jgi:hypothetical protein
LFFLVLTLMDVSVILQVVASGVFAAVETRVTREHEKADLERFSEGQNLPRLSRNRGTTWWYTSSLYVVWIGFVLVTCFTAQILAEIV